MKLLFIITLCTHFVSHTFSGTQNNNCLSPSNDSTPVDSMVSDKINAKDFEKSLWIEFQRQKDSSTHILQTDTVDPSGWCVKYKTAELDTIYVEEGYLKNGRKHGLWLRKAYNSDTLVHLLSFKHNRPNGDFILYKSGIMTKLGKWHGSQYEWYLTLYPSGCKKMYYKANSYKIDYSNNCDTTRKQLGALTKFTNNNYVACSWSNTTSVTSSYQRFSLEPNNWDCDSLSEENYIASIILDKWSDEWVKVYSSDNSLLFFGLIKNNRMYDGKIYCYDQDGLLEKVTIVKDGIYQGDGKIEFDD